jgi:hypothetical protein
VVAFPLFEVGGDFLLEGTSRHIPEQGHFFVVHGIA